MLTATQLTAWTQSKSPRRNDYRGLSDHRPNAQQLTFLDGKTLTVCTWNVLNPAYVHCQSGKPPSGKTMPSWCCDRKEAQGMDWLPQFQPASQPLRQQLVADAIRAFLAEHKEKTVLCLQEVWPELCSQIRSFHSGFLIERGIADCFKLVVLSPDLLTSDGPSTPNGIVITLTGYCQLACVHLCLKTKSQIGTFQDILGAGNSLILGDFSIQTAPISPKPIQEENTMTLKEIVETLAPKYGPITFAPHPEGWTNWNARKNIAINKEANHDHFDNIMAVGFLVICEPIAFDPQFPDY